MVANPLLRRLCSMYQCQKTNPGAQERFKHVFSCPMSFAMLPFDSQTCIVRRGTGRALVGFLGTFLPLRVQTLPKKGFWGGFTGLNPFSGGTWTPRVRCFLANKIIKSYLTD